MKLLGLNFGRVKGTSRQYLDIAVEEAKKTDPSIEVEVIDCIKLKINRCIGCGYCSRQLMGGQDQISCVQADDDYIPLMHKVLEADAIIVASPVYVLAPSGQIKNFVDRFGPAHDKAFMLFENELRKETGGVPLDPNCLKKHLVSFISVGGARTDHWVSFGLSQLDLFAMSINMKVVDKANIHGLFEAREQEEKDPDTGAVKTVRKYFPDEERIAKATEEAKHMGRRLVENYGKKNSEIAWESAPGICPVCHNNEMTFSGTDTLCCPVCGIYGTLKMDGHRTTVEFTEEEMQRSRMRFVGVLEHQIEHGRQVRYPHFEENIEKFKAMEDDM